MANHENTRDINDMYAQAYELIADDTDPVSADVIVLASNRPKAVRNAIYEAHVAEINASVFDKLVPLDVARGKQLANSLDQTSMELARRRRRTWLGGALACAAAVGTFFLITSGEADYELQEGAKPTGTLLSHNSLVYDSSIMPGNDGANWPVVGPILRNIPGIPDSAPASLKEVIPVKKLVKQTEHVISQTNSQRGALNPLSPNLQLTGREETADEQLADEVIKIIKGEHLQVDRVAVEGLASDDFGGRVGEPNAPQQELATARAQVAVAILEKEASKKHVELPAIHPTGHEVVLTQPEINQLSHLAQANHLTDSELIAKYNHPKDAKTLDLRTQNFLFTHLANNRGVDISITGHRNVLKTIKKTIYKNESVTKYFNNLPGEAIFSIIALPVALVGACITYMGQYRRYAHKRAKRMVAKAGIEL